MNNGYLKDIFIIYPAKIDIIRAGAGYACPSSACLDRCFKPLTRLYLYRGSLFVSPARTPVVPLFVARFRQRNLTSHGTTVRFRPLPRIKPVLTACFPGPTRFFDSAGLALRLGPKSPKTTSVWTARHSLERNARGEAARHAGGAMSGVTRPGPCAIPAARQAWVVMASQPTCDGRLRLARQRLAPRAPLVLHQALLLSGRDDTYIRVMLLPAYVSSPLLAPNISLLPG